VGELISANDDRDQAGNFSYRPGEEVLKSLEASVEGCPLRASNKSLLGRYAWHLQAVFQEPHQRLPHGAQFNELAEDKSNGPLHPQVWIFFQTLVLRLDVANRCCLD
jgi:hypothetical protein